MIVATAATSCSGAQAPGPAAPAPTLTRFPIGAPLVTPGERFSYRVQLAGVDLATYDFAIGDLSDANGKPAILVQSHAKTVGLASMVANVDDSFASLIDAATGRPLRWQCEEYASHSKNKEHTEARFADRANDVVPVDFHLNDLPVTPEPQTVSMDDVWDFNAMMIELRSWQAAVGTAVDFEVFRSRYMWHGKMTFRGGRDIIHTELGDLPAHRLDGHVYKLDRADHKVAGDDERDFSVWISDDDGRVPLKITAKTDYGDVILSLTSYDPGTGQRLGG